VAEQHGSYSGFVSAVKCTIDAVAVIASGNFTCSFKASIGDDGKVYGGCLATAYVPAPQYQHGGSIILAPGSTASVSNWLNGADNVTVTSAVETTQNDGLSALSYSVGGGAAISAPGFNWLQSDCNVTLPYGTDPSAHITLNPTTMAPGATITQNAGVTLSGGAGTAAVTVRSQDGSATMTYTVHFTTATANFHVAGAGYVTLEEAAAAVTDGDTITMQNDVALATGATLNRNKAYTLDLGGNTLSNNAENIPNLLTVAAGTVTIQNGFIKNTGLTNTGLYVAGSGTAFILSGDYSGDGNAIGCSSTAAIAITQGHFLSTNNSGSSAGCIATVGGTISLAAGSTASVANWLNGAMDVAVTGARTVSVGAQYNQLFTGTLNYDYFDVTTSNIAAGAPITLNGAPAGVTMSYPQVTAGNHTTIQIRVDAAVAAGTYPLMLSIAGVVSNSFVLVVSPLLFQNDDGALFGTLDAAATAVADGGTIKMLDNVAFYNTVSLNSTQNKTYTIDLGGHTISNAQGVSSILSIWSGTVTICHGQISVANMIQSAACIMAIGGNTILDNLTINADNVVGSYAIQAFNGMLTIRSGEYSGNNTVLLSGSNNGTAIIEAGHFQCASGSTTGCMATSGNGKILLAQGFVANVYPWLNTAAAKDVTVTAAWWNYGILWTGAAGADWDDSNNWQGGQTPAETDIVTIPGDAANFPVLTQPTAVAEIHFRPGAQIGGQHYLTGKAFVQYDLSKRNSWQMLSMPLGEAYPADFVFGGYPLAWVRTFTAAPAGSATEGGWTTLQKSAQAFTYGDGFVLMLDADGGTTDNSGKGLKLLSNTLELPCFENFAEGAANHQFYQNVNLAQDYESGTGQGLGTSTFHNFNLDNNEYVRGSDSYPVTRDDAAFRLASGQTLQYNTNFYGGFALIGNPFMAALDFNQFSANNSSAIKDTYYIWTDNGYAGYSCLVDEPIGVAATTPMNKYIAPLQGFIVESSSATDASSELTFDETMAKVNKEIVLRSSVNDGDKLNIIAGNPVAEVRTAIAKREGGQAEFGNLDARMIMNNISDVPEVYTLKPYKGGLIATAVNIINSDDLLIPVGLATSYTGDVTLSFTGMNACDANISLIDTGTNQTIDLTGLASYDYLVAYTPKVINGVAVACEDRFYISISKTLTGLAEPAGDKVNVYESNGYIRIISGASNPIKEVAAYNIQGALMYKANAGNAISYTIKENWISGVYIVRVISEKSVDNVKLTVK